MRAILERREVLGRGRERFPPTSDHYLGDCIRGNRTNSDSFARPHGRPWETNPTLSRRARSHNCQKSYLLYWDQALARPQVWHRGRAFLTEEWLLDLIRRLKRQGPLCLGLAQWNQNQPEQVVKARVACRNISRLRLLRYRWLLTFEILVS